MPSIPGENIAPGPGQGAAFLLPNRSPSAISLFAAGQAQTARAARDAATLRQKQEAAKAKEIADDYKFDQDGSPLFGTQLNERVYKPVVGQLSEVYQQHRDDAFARKTAAAPIIQRVNNESVQSKSKTAYLKDKLKSFSSDPVYNAQYATENLAKAIGGEDGKGLLPSEFDVEKWEAGVMGDPNAYVEKEVVTRTAKDLFPIITQRVADAGRLGGQHTANTVRGRLVAYDGQGNPRFNADGTPVMNLTSDTEALLDSDPRFKLLTDKRVADYEKARAENIEARKTDLTIPELPAMSRRGHHATMLGPLAFYDTTKDEGLNAQVPRPRVAKDDPKKVVVSDFVGSRQSDYQDEGGVARTNHYAEVGQTFGSAAKPYVEVSAPTAGLTIIGQDGKPTNTNQIKGGGNTKVNAQARVYSVYTKSGKRLGSNQPFANDQAAADYAMKLVREYPKPQDLELRVEGRGILEDDQRIAGDGLGGNVQMHLVPATSTKPAHMAPDNSVRKTQRTVLFPITQEIDDQLSRATNGQWNRFKHSKAQAELMREVQKRGGKFVSPYTHAQRDAHGSPKAQPKPQRPAFLQAPAANKPTTKNKNTPPSADLSGGML